MIYDLRFTRVLFFTKRVAQFALVFFALSQLLTGCKPSNAMLSKRIIGTWKQDISSGWIAYKPDGSYQYKHGDVVTNGTEATGKEVGGAGFWKIENGFLIVTPITKGWN